MGISNTLIAYIRIPPLKHDFGLVYAQLYCICSVIETVHNLCLWAFGGNSQQTSIFWSWFAYSLLCVNSVGDSFETVKYTCVMLTMTQLPWRFQSRETLNPHQTRPCIQYIQQCAIQTCLYIREIKTDLHAEVYKYSQTDSTAGNQDDYLTLKIAHFEKKRRKSMDIDIVNIWKVSHYFINIALRKYDKKAKTSQA